MKEHLETKTADRKENLEGASGREKQNQEFNAGQTGGPLGSSPTIPAWPQIDEKHTAGTTPTAPQRARECRAVEFWQKASEAWPSINIQVRPVHTHPKRNQKTRISSNKPPAHSKRAQLHKNEKDEARDKIITRSESAAQKEAERRGPVTRAQEKQNAEKKQTGGPNTTKVKEDRRTVGRVGKIFQERDRIRSRCDSRNFETHPTHKIQKCLIKTRRSPRPCVKQKRVLFGTDSKKQFTQKSSLWRKNKHGNMLTLNPFLHEQIFLDLK